MAWIGVDLDGTLARYDGWKDGKIGPPIRLMVRRVKAWLKEGKDVRIFTARAGPQPSWETAEEREVMLQRIRDWCFEHLGKELPITATKDFEMVELWDDRCVQVVPNTGIPVVDEILDAPRIETKVKKGWTG